MSISVDSKSNQKKTNEPKAELQIGLSGIFITFIWGCSMLPSLIGLFFYYKYYFKHYQSEIAQFIPIFTKLDVFVAVTITAIVIWILYFIRLLFVILFTKISLIYCNSQSKPIEMVGATGVGKEEYKNVNIYHLRGTILRILKWSISKSVFPWMVTWAFNRVGSNKFGKNTVIEDQFICQEFLETGENVYIGQGTQASSHLVEGGYGAITLKKLKIGDNSVIGAYDLISPGVEIGPFAEIAPMSAILKFQKLKGFTKYYGLPVFRLSRHRYMKILKIPEECEEVLKRTKDLKKSYKQKRKRSR